MHYGCAKCIPTVQTTYLGMKYAVGAQKYAVGSFSTQLGKGIECLQNLSGRDARLICQEAEMLGLMLGWVRRCRMMITTYRMMFLVEVVKTR